MTDKAQPASKPVPTSVPAPKAEPKPVDITHELGNYDAQRLLNVVGSKPSDALVVGDTVYIATADATGAPKLVVESLQWLQSAYGKA